MKIMGACVMFLVFTCGIAIANDVAEREAAQKAAESHAKANEDMIYAQQDIKALYYQNQQIIELLKDIRTVLREDKKRNESVPVE